MKICGIVAEFNPFHNGHKYLINAAKEEICPDGIVCVMSGDFVQRGQIAYEDKWSRAEAAVKGGADLVIELPTVFAVSSAPDFAFGSMKILKTAGCTDLAFGSETADLDFLHASSPERKEPNDILASEYLKNSEGITVHPFKRTGEGEQESASKLRSENIDLTAENKLFELVRYAILSTNTSRLKEIYSVAEGLENLLRKSAIQAKNFNELVMGIKSKRYSYTRISRILIQILLDIDKNTVDNAKNAEPYIRPLAFNKTGKDILSAIKKDAAVITNPDRNNSDPVLKKDIYAAEIYNCIKTKDLYANSDYVLAPKFIKDL